MSARVLPQPEAVQTNRDCLCAVQRASKHCPKECSFDAGTDRSLEEGPESEVAVDARGTGRT